MANKVLDALGLKCPQPVLKLAIKAKICDPGTAVEVHADCPSFSTELRKWCDDTGKVLISLVEQGGTQVATVQF